MTVVSTSPAGVSIVVPNWNGRALLEEFLPTVIRSAAAYESVTGQPTEVIVSDDASTDDSIAWLREHCAGVRVEAGKSRGGFAPNANRGIRAARFPLVYLVNSDVAMGTETLPAAAAHFRDGNVFVVSSQAYDYATGELRGAGQRGDFRRGFLGVHGGFFAPGPSASSPPLFTLYAGGGSSLFDREKFLSLGGFDEMMAPFGWEDVELSLRAWKQGFEVRYEPRSGIWHQFSSTIATRFRPRHVKAIYERNRLLAHWIHLDTAGEAAAHAFSVALKLLTSPLAGRLEIWSAFGQALARWDQVKARRATLRTTQKRTLAEVLQMVDAQMTRSDVRRLDSASAPVVPFDRAASLESPARSAASSTQRQSR